jgi:hypothetical protein
VVVADEAFPARLWAMADLFTPMALRVAATLRLADHVAGGARSVPALAERTGADSDALGRLVGHLLSIGVLDGDAGDLSLGELGEQLCDGHPGNGRAWLDIDGAVGRADLAALHLLNTVRTGQPAYPLTYGRAFWEDLGDDPGLSASFDALMGSRLRFEAPEIVAGYDWGQLGHIVDVGGGDGTLLAAILTAHPGLRGTLVDLDGPAAAARSTLAAAGLASRCDVVAGSFFESLPAGHDAYLLSAVLHNWDDEHALAILRRCVEAAAGSAGRVLVIEELLEGATESGLRTEMDLRMLAYMGGRERTLADLASLAERTGLSVAAVHRATRYRTIIDLRASHSPGHTGEPG